MKQPPKIFDDKDDKDKFKKNVMSNTHNFNMPMHINMPFH